MYFDAFCTRVYIGCLVYVAGYQYLQLHRHHSSTKQGIRPFSVKWTVNYCQMPQHSLPYRLNLSQICWRRRPWHLYNEVILIKAFTGCTCFVGKLALVLWGNNGTYPVCLGRDVRRKQCYHNHFILTDVDLVLYEKNDYYPDTVEE